MITKREILTAGDSLVRAYFAQLGKDPSGMTMSDIRAHCIEYIDAGFEFTEPPSLVGDPPKIRLSKLSRELGVDVKDVVDALQNATGEMIERKPNIKLTAEQADAIRESISEKSESGSVEGEISDDVQSAFDDAAQEQDAEKSKQIEMLQDWKEQMLSREGGEMSYEEMAAFFELTQKIARSQESVNQPNGDDEAENDPQKDEVEEGEDGGQEQEGLRFDLIEAHRPLDDADVAKWHAEWKEKRALETKPDDLPF